MGQRFSLVLGVCILLPLGLFAPASVHAQPDARITYIDDWAAEDDSGRRAAYPHGIAWDWEGNLLVAPSGGGPIMRCSTSGECELYRFRNVRKMVVDQDRNVLMTAPGAHKVLICDTTGACPGSFGSFGSEPGQFNHPMGITIDSLGRIVVADRWNNRIQFCNLQGACTVSAGLGSGGQFREPASVKIDGKGALYVGELGDEYVHVCNEDGSCSKRLGTEGTGIGQFKTPISVELSSRGDLVILELSNHRIQVCDLDNKCFSYGENGTGPGQFYAPGDMVMDEDDRIYVADLENNRVQVLQLAYNSPPPDPGPAPDINGGHAGAWYWPATSGQGQFIDVEPESSHLFIGWFTYTGADSENPNEQQWYTAQGNYSGNSAVLELNETLGGRFLEQQGVNTRRVGAVMIEFEDCESGTLSYEFDNEGPVGSFPLLRALPGSENGCKSVATSNTRAVGINDDMDGAWYEPGTPGQGFFFDVFTGAGGEQSIFISWFTYGDATASGQRWLTGQGSFEGSRASLELHETTGGSFNDPRPVETVRAGTMTIDFTDCETAVLGYMLDDAGQEGEIGIIRAVPGGESLCEELSVQE